MKQITNLTFQCPIYRVQLFQDNGKKDATRGDQRSLSAEEKGGKKQHIIFFKAVYITCVRGTGYVIGTKTKGGLAGTDTPIDSRKKDQTEGKIFRLKSRNTRSYIYRQTREKLSRD